MAKFNLFFFLKVNLLTLLLCSQYHTIYQYLQKIVLLIKSHIVGHLSITTFLVVFFVTKKTTLCRHSRCLSVRPSVRPSSVEITLERDFDRSAEPIDLKIGLNIGN